MDSFDYVIVGAGSAGSVLANRLTEDGSTTVCVLEAGGSDWQPFIHVPAGFMKTMADPPRKWLSDMEPSEVHRGPPDGAPRGTPPSGARSEVRTGGSSGGMRRCVGG